MTRSTTRPAAIALLAVMVLTLLAPGGGGAGHLAAQEAKKLAAPAAAKPKPAAPVDDKVIFPFLTDETFVVGRLDVDRVDFAALERWVNKMSEMVARTMGVEAEDLEEEVKADTDESLKELRTWLDGFTGAGGRAVYVLLDRESLVFDAEIEVDVDVEVDADADADHDADAKADAEGKAPDEDDDGAGDGPVLLVPVGKEADREKLEELVSELDMSGELAMAEFGNVLVFATKAQVQALKRRVDPAAKKPDAGKPVAAPPERPDLVKAFAAAGNAPLRLAFVPTGESGQEFMEETFSGITEEVGAQGDLELISQGLRWASIALAQEPTLTVHLTLRAADAERAKGLEGLLTRLIAHMKEKMGGDAEEEEGGQDLVKQMESVKPKLAGETVTLSFDPMFLQMVAFAGMAFEGEIDADDAKPDKPDDGGL